MPDMCPNNRPYDPDGMCTCPEAHQKPEALADDVARLHGATVPSSCTVPRCPNPRCPYALEEEGHTDECRGFWEAAGRPS